MPLYKEGQFVDNTTQFHRGIVLMVEQRSPKPTVESSSLSAPATSSKNLYKLSKIYPKFNQIFY